MHCEMLLQKRRGKKGRLQYWYSRHKKKDGSSDFNLEIFISKIHLDLVDRSLKKNQ